MKLKVLVDHQEHLKQLTEMPFDIQTVWDLADSYDAVMKALEKFQETRNGYLKTDGTPKEGNPGMFDLKDPVAFQAKVDLLLAVDVKITFPKIPFSEFKDKKVNAAQLLSWKALGIIEKPEKKKNEK